MTRNWRASLLALLMSTSAALIACLAVPAAADDIPPGHLVYPLDPTLDLTSTRPGWEKPFLDQGDCSNPARPIINPPLQVKPFTEAEVIALAKQAGRYLPPPIGKSGPGLVQTKEKVAVSPAVYASQLNHIETFLAQYGYSLRDPNLGTVARLRPRDLACTSLASAFTPPSLRPAPPDWHIREEYRAETQWRSNPVLRQWVTRQTFEPVRSVNLSRERSQSLKQWWESEGTRWIGSDWRNAQRFRRRTADRTPAIASRQMKPMLEPILARDLGGGRFLFTAPGGVGVSMPMSGNCGGFGSDVALNGVCPPEDADNPQCHPSSGGVSETATGGDYTASTCGNNAGCLRKGDFLLNMTPWKACVGQNGGFHGWFGAESCILIKSENAGKEGDFSMSDAVGLSSGLTIFTFPIDLVDAEIMTRYTTAGGPKAYPPKLGGLLPALGQSTSCCDPIDGPGATLPIGPLLLAITSKLEIHVNPANLNASAGSLPNDCPKGMKTILSIQGSATASSSATFFAGLTAYVATAGIEGHIQFTDDTLQGSIKTDADMGGNLLRVTPAMTYNMNRLKGTLSARVDVDLFVATKSWKIELASWDGYHTPKTLGNKAGQVSACPDAKAQCAPTF